MINSDLHHMLLITPVVLDIFRVYCEVSEKVGDLLSFFDPTINPLSEKAERWPTQTRLRPRSWRTGLMTPGRRSLRWILSRDKGGYRWT